MATDRIVLDAALRTNMSKGERNRIRRAGHLPGILYGKDIPPTPVTINGESFKQLRGHGKALVDVNIQGNRTVSALVNEISRDMINRQPTHIDLYAVNLSAPITVDVPIILDGLEPVEKRGGVIQQQTREVAVRCLPTEVPEFILHNISNLEVGMNSTLGELQLPAGVTLHDDAETVICSVTEATRNVDPETEINPHAEPQLVDARIGRE